MLRKLRDKVRVRKVNLNAAFRRLDSDHNGYVPVEDVIQLVKSLGVSDDELRRVEAEILPKYDPQSNGLIKWIELE